ncbi:hypothetical protein AAVH_05859 [Aphelenchoides avenae]|nr:hypothetical protein AAVH_05859 [Aphelenchus avenae]
MQIEQGEDGKVVVPHLKTAETAPCPQDEWLQVIKDNIGADASSSVYAIQSALYRKYETKFLVTCAPKGDSLPQFVTNGDGYCATSSETLWCQAFALVA